MTNLTEKLRLKALAEEDIYFAKRDRELIKALHERKLAKHLKIEKKKTKKKAKRLQKEFAAVTAQGRHRPRKLAEIYRKLIKKCRRLVARH